MKRFMICALAMMALAGMASAQQLTYTVASRSWSIGGDSEVWIKKNGDYTGFWDGDIDADSGNTTGTHVLPSGNLAFSKARDGVSTAEVKECRAHVDSGTILSHQYINADTQVEAKARVDNAGTPVYHSHANSAAWADFEEDLTITDANKGTLQWVEAKLRVECSVNGGYGNITQNCYAYASLNNESYLVATWKWNGSANEYQWEVVRRIRMANGQWEAANPITTWYDQFSIQIFYVTGCLVNTNFEMRARANYDSLQGGSGWWVDATALTAGQSGAEDFSHTGATPLARVTIQSVTRVQ